MREPHGRLVGLELAESGEGIDTAIVWNASDDSAAAAAFREVASQVFEGERLIG
jgi:hypothetical protein